MAKNGWPAMALLCTVALLMASLATVAAVGPEEPMLVRIELRGPADLDLVEAANIPVYARPAMDGASYLLAGATPEAVAALQGQGLEVTVLDPEMGEAGYYLVARRGSGQPPVMPPHVNVVHRDGMRVVVRGTPAEANGLAAAGYDVSAVSQAPIALRPQGGTAISGAVQREPLVEAMVAQVDTATLAQYEAWLTGMEAAAIGGQPYTIATRYTFSGRPIQMATQFVYEHLESLGLSVDYDQWAHPTYPNVIATKPGLALPEEIYIISAHLDDMPPGPRAPGADDNASGVTGVLVAADILSQYNFYCTLKFALWTAEEQGLLGSNAWAEQASEQGLAIGGVLNMDMIAYDSDDSPVVDLHARSWMTESVAMANLFAGVVDVYEIDLVPEVVLDNWVGDHSDNWSFWDKGYPAILAIEDKADFSPYYHTEGDTVSTLNMDYFTEFVKAAVAAFAHTSDCLVVGGMGSLQGQVIAAGQGTPIAGATVQMRDGAGHTFAATAGPSGAYTRSLPAEVYTVTASARGYEAVTVPGVSVVSGTISTQDLSLEAAAVTVVAPQELAASLYPEERITHTLWLTNAGFATLTFSLQERYVGLHGSGPLPWLSESPTSGNLAPGKATSIAVAFDATGLGPGMELGYLDLESNDPAAPVMGIPVTLTVQAFRLYLPVIVRGE